jgi:hypothetical protein
MLASRAPDSSEENRREECTAAGRIVDIESLFSNDFIVVAVGDSQGTGCSAVESLLKSVLGYDRWISVICPW